MILSLLGLDPNSAYIKSQILCSLNSKPHDYSNCHCMSWLSYKRGAKETRFWDSTELRTKKI